MMKKAVLILVCVAIALLVAIGTVFAQAKAGIVGAWTGYAILGDGSRADFVLTVAKGDEGLTARLTEESGAIPEIVCRNVVFAENKLTFDIDFPDGMEVVLVKIALSLEGDSLKGIWTDQGGNSDIVEFARKK
jgi:hypothetical protein